MSVERLRLVTKGANKDHSLSSRVPTCDIGRSQRIGWHIEPVDGDFHGSRGAQTVYQTAQPAVTVNRVREHSLWYPMCAGKRGSVEFWDAQASELACSHQIIGWQGIQSSKETSGAFHRAIGGRFMAMDGWLSYFGDFVITAVVLRGRSLSIFRGARRHRRDEQQRDRDQRTCMRRVKKGKINPNSLLSARKTTVTLFCQ